MSLCTHDSFPLGGKFFMSFRTVAPGMAWALWTVNITVHLACVSQPVHLYVIIMFVGQAVALALWTVSVVTHLAAGRVLLVARLPGSASALSAAGGIAGAVAAVAFSQVRTRQWSLSPSIP